MAKPRAINRACTHMSANPVLSCCSQPMALVALLAAVLRPAVRADAGGCRCRGAHQAGVKLGWYGGEVCALHPRAASFPAASVLIAACRRPQSATVQASGQRGQPRCRLKLRSRGCAVRPARIGCGHRPHGFEVPVRFCQHPQRRAMVVPPTAS